MQETSLLAVEISCSVELSMKKSFITSGLDILDCSCLYSYLGIKMHSGIQTPLDKTRFYDL